MVGLDLQTTVHVLDMPCLIKEYETQVPGRGGSEAATAALPSSAVPGWRLSHWSRARFQQPSGEVPIRPFQIHYSQDYRRSVILTGTS